MASTFEERTVLGFSKGWIAIFGAGFGLVLGIVLAVLANLISVENKGEWFIGTWQDIAIAAYLIALWAVTCGMLARIVYELWRWESRVAVFGEVLLLAIFGAFLWCCTAWYEGEVNGTAVYFAGLLGSCAFAAILWFVLRDKRR